MVGRRQALVKSKSNKKGLKAGAAMGVTAALFAFTPWFFGLGGLAVTGYYAYDWLKYRGKWGIRF